MAVKTKTQLHTDTAALPAPITRVSLIAVLDDMIDSYEDIVQQFTTVQRDALAGVDLYLARKIFNTTNARMEFYNGTTWIACSQKQTVAVDCSANPNYQEGSVGDQYIVSVAGKIGGAIGKDVYVGDIVYCIVKSAAGDEAAAGVKWQVCHSQGISDNQTFYAEISLSSAEILALFTTPKQLVAAPGAGKVIIPMSFVFNFSWNSIAYATNTNMVALIGTVSGQIAVINNVANYNRVLNGITVYDGSVISNQALRIGIATGDPTAGNSTMTVGVYYKIHTL